MSINSLRKKLLEQKENGTLNAGYTAPELQIMNQNSADTYTPPEVVVPTTQPKTTPISSNTQTPKTRPITTQTTTTAKNTTIPSSAKNSSQAPADPKSGAAGAKTMKEIQTSKPSVYIKKNKFLAEAYSAGFNGMDISRETRDNARAGGYLDQIEAMYKAGKQDSKGSPTTDKSEKTYNGLSTEAVRNEKLSLNNNRNTANSNYTQSNNAKSTNYKLDNGLNTEEARKEQIMLNKNRNTTNSTDKQDSKEESTNENIDIVLSGEALRKQKILHKKIDNLGKSGYNPGNIIGNGKDENSGDFHGPTETFPNVTREYGFHDKDKKGNHMGIDIGNAANQNLDIRPAYYGVVVFSGDTGGDNGNMVVIKHSININGTDVEFYTSYSHLASIKKSVGDTADPNDYNDLIGIMGETGDSDGVHLHFAIFTREGEIDKTFSPWGYGSEQINEYAWKKSSDSNAIYYDPLEVFRTNGAIILDTLNFLEEEKKKNAKNN